MRPPPPRIHRGELRVGDHVITPLDRRAVVVDVRCCFGKVRLRYLNDGDAVYLDEKHLRRARDEVAA